MGALAISLGAFILFGLAFVGGLGEIYYTLPILISGILMICVGISSMSNKNTKMTFYLACVSFITYTPIFIQLFSSANGIDWLAVTFNVIIVLLIGLLASYYKPNKALKSVDA